MRFLFVSLLTLSLAGCFSLSGGYSKRAQLERPQAMLDYYRPKESYSQYREEFISQQGSVTYKKITIMTESGALQIDLYEHTDSDDDLVFVFPVLGGKPVIERHIAIFLAEHGIDAAIVNRNNEFKDPSRFDQLESIFRDNVVRDRLAIDFFEAEYGKRDFGTFGISRGGINVALTAGVDSRLKHNVMVMGGTDLVDIFRRSDQRRIQSYVKEVSAEKGIPEEDFFKLLKERIITDPRNTAHYIDGKHALLILSVFDKTVPFSYGMRLREQLGNPRTIFLMADHYLGLLFTQTVSLVPPKRGAGLFPFPYIEEEALSFFREEFGRGSNWGVTPFRILQAPFNVLAEAFNLVGSGIGQAIEGEAEQYESRLGAWNGAEIPVLAKIEDQPERAQLSEDTFDELYP